MFIYCRLCDASRWLACVDQACESTTTRAKSHNLPAADSSRSSRPVSKSPDAKLRCSNTPTTIFQPTATTSAASASATDTTNAKLPSVSTTYAPTEQDAPRAAATEPLESIESHALAANAAHAAHAEPCTTTCHTALAGSVSASDPCSGWAGAFTRQNASSTSKRSETISLFATKMGDPGRELWQPQCKRDSD